MTWHKWPDEKPPEFRVVFVAKRGDDEPVVTTGGRIGPNIMFAGFKDHDETAELWWAEIEWPEELKV